MKKYSQILNTLKSGYQMGFHVALLVIFTACQSDSNELEDMIITDETSDNLDQDEGVSTVDYSLIESVFGDLLSLTSPFNYEAQEIPDYIDEDNTNGNVIQDEIATLGRVLFYDKNLSVDNTVSCASCHRQEVAFGDDSPLSEGVNGETGRHSMRLVNARFAEEERFFWDERAASLEEQTTMPIQDHVEMGFSGENGDPGIDDLVEKLESLDYMLELFDYAFGDSAITEARMQIAMAQFVRSIQSFDSEYDLGRSQTNDRTDDFPNFTAQENLGKALFFGRAGCDRCHQGDEFSIDPDSGNNGVISVANSDELDLDVTRSPSLRDIFNPAGELNGSLMHDGSFESMNAVVAHYNDIDITDNPTIDPRLRGGRQGNGENLNLSQNEMDAIVAFVKTLTGRDIYTNEKWSDPFIN